MTVSLAVLILLEDDVVVEWLEVLLSLEVDMIISAVVASASLEFWRSSR